MGISAENFFQTTDGARIYFEEYGKQHGRPILLVPGFLCTTKFFGRNIGALSQQHHVVVVDPRGQGFSSKTLSGNTIKRNAQDLAELISHLNLRDLALLGWSVGASVALWYATKLDHEKRLSGLLLVDGSLFPLSGESWNKHRARDYDIESWMETYLPLYHQPQEFHRRFLDRISNGMMSREDRQWVLDECSKTMPWTALELHYDFCHTNSLPCLSKLRVPVAFFGAKSEAYGLDMLYEYAGHVKAPSRIHPFEQSGHMLFFYEAEKFNHLVCAFRDELPNADRWEAPL